jgi:hypothetical protein
MVKGLAEQSGGYFKLRSKKGGGTRAEIYPPVAPSAAEEIVIPWSRRGTPERRCAFSPSMTTPWSCSTPSRCLISWDTSR